MKLSNKFLILIFSVMFLFSCDQSNIWEKGTSKIKSLVPSFTVQTKNNTNIEVVFSAEMNSSALTNINNYSINGLAISNISLDQVDPSIITITTGSQTLDSYTIEINNITDIFLNPLETNSISFISDKLPDVTDVIPINNTVIKVSFSKKMNSLQLTDINNYLIAGLAVQSINIVQIDPSIVDLTIDSQVENTYTLQVINITDLSLNTLNISSITFVADKLPDLTGDPIPTSSTTVEIDLLETINLNASTFEITDPLPALMITDKIYKDGTDKKTLILTTEMQTEGTVYTLEITLKDNNGNGNVGTVIIKSFTGVAP